MAQTIGLGWNRLWSRPKSAHQPARLVAAIVTGVRDDDTVDLVVFEPNCLPLNVERVPTAQLSEP